MANHFEQLSIPESLVEQIREAWVKRVEEIFTTPGSWADPAAANEVIASIKAGEKLPANSWAGDALPNLQIMRSLPPEQRQMVLDLLLKRE